MQPGASDHSELSRGTKFATIFGAALLAWALVIALILWCLP